MTPKANLKFPLRDFTLHKRFLKEGKATLHLKDLLTKLMISNAPPNSLLSLLKILSSKTENVHKTVPARERMLSLLPQTFDEISPLTVKVKCNFV